MSGPQSGASVPVTGAVVIGRSRSAGLHFDERTLSRLHARLEPADGEWRLTDLGSSNGSFVNGRPVKPAVVLRDGDVVRLGSFSFAFRADPPGVPALNVTLDTGAEQAPIIENVSVDEHIQQLLPKGIEKDAGELVIKRLRFLSEVADILGNVIEAAQLFPRVLEKLFEVFPEAERGCVMACDPDGGNLRP
ncbi:MAG TPA: FHA domain-containing protein, partial [Desulfobacterales bacterium]|nr:FHA domain-containing protein [Desulfobacterales bacterium]